MSDLQTTFTEVQDHFPEAAMEIVAAFAKKFARASRPTLDPNRLQWFYAFEADRDADGRSTNDINIAIYAKDGRMKHRVDHWREHGPLNPEDVPPSLEYVLTIEEEGVQPHNTPHAATITWKHSSADKFTDYLVCGGVEKANGSLRIAVVHVGAAAFLRSPSEVERPYVWVKADEDRIVAVNDVSPKLAKLVWNTEPGDELTYRRGEMRRLTAEELRRFDGIMYEGEARVQGAPRP